MYFFSSHEAETAEAICSRIVPSVDPVSGAPAAGAREAMAFVYIDRLLAAFDAALLAGAADNPAIYLRGPYSGRFPFGDPAKGSPSGDFPEDAFLSADGQAHFFELSALQTLAWRATFEGVEGALSQAPGFVSPAWKRQVASGMLPSPGPSGGWDELYREGLAAFDSYAASISGTRFADAPSKEQDLMLQAAGNDLLSAVPLPSPPAAPPAAKALFPVIELHTFEGCYGLPEYRWTTGSGVTAIWREIGWDGDTQPLGNSAYDADLAGAGAGPNEGFGDPDVYQPAGGYREYRPVSTLGSKEDVLTETDLARLVDAMSLRGVISRSTRR